MPFDKSRYKVDDANHYDDDASLEDGAVLYRIASISHWEKRFIFTGFGATKGDGRFHKIHQLTTYCANNVLLCIAEVLYHMYRRVLDGIREKQPPRLIDSWATADFRLVALSVFPIIDLVYADTEGVRLNYDARIVGSTLVFPDPIYGPLHDFSDMMRHKVRTGVIYPSARHSVDLALALFLDNTNKIKNDFYEVLPIRLQLVPEDQDFTAAPVISRPIVQKLHATIGYYNFTDTAAFSSLKSNGLLNPRDIPERGYIDFVRRRYDNYPSDAYLG
jgi:hypothetical protein